ncbi:aminoglycoside phosphotransferase family protein [Streptomyces sp. NPDC053367]|uniref:aminoglycoside phosphotransferase family protein n=1 Tax=Streptomyces sp. NPDC053367 TaxID=3365700 RepID=UPI0037D5D712
MTDIPEELAATQARYNGEAGRAFIAALPALITTFLDRWNLRPDGPPRYGVCALVLPVVRGHDTRAALKLQLQDPETTDEPLALRAWAGDGAVRLLDHDPATGTMLLERLDAARPLSSHPDTREAARIVAGLLVRLTATRAPRGLRDLGDITRALLDRTPKALARVPYEPVRRLLTDCASATAEVAADPGDRLLHWDLHYDNVLASERAPWLAIDPKPLAGDPAFELLPALLNRFDVDEILPRFDTMTGEMSLDRARAAAWTMARALQNAVWATEEGLPPAPENLEIARRLRSTLHS